MLMTGYCLEHFTRERRTTRLAEAERARLAARASSGASFWAPVRAALGVVRPRRRLQRA